MKQIFKMLTLTIAGVLLATSAANSDVVFDGSFETAFHHYGIVADNPPGRTNQTWQDTNPSLFLDPVGPNTGWYLQSIPGILSGGSIDVAATDQGFGALVPGYAAQDGNLVVDLIGTPSIGALNQIVETIPGMHYELTFYISSNQENEYVDGQPLPESDRQLQVWWDGMLLDTLNAPKMGTWTPHVYQVVASGTTGQLGFAGVNTPNSRVGQDSVVPVFNIPVLANEAAFGALLDNVSLVAVPEPSSTALISVCVGLLAIRRKRSL